MKCFIIRLPENAHSCNVAKDCYDQCKQHNIHAQYFDAINGNDANFHYKKTNVPKPKIPIKQGRPGVLGCFFSHYYLWKKSVELNEPLIILEHDGYFIKKLPENVLERFDDVLKLDQNDPYSKNYNQTIKNEENKEIEIIDYYNQKAKAINTGNYFRGAYSYIIKPHAAQRIVDFTHKYSHVAADQQIGSNIVRLQTTSITLARLHPFYSIEDNIKTASLTKNLK